MTFKAGDLLTAQWEFTEDLARLIVFVRSKGWRIKLTEVGVAQKRNTAGGLLVTDGVHMLKSNHYRDLAADIVLFIPDSVTPNLWFHVERSDNPAWKDIDAYWCSLHPDNITGIGFQDANHVSRKWEGVA